MMAVIQQSIMSYTRTHKSHAPSHNRYALNHGLDSIELAMMTFHHQASNNAAMRSHAARIEASRQAQKNEAYRKYIYAVKRINERHDRQLSTLSVSTYRHALY